MSQRYEKSEKLLERALLSIPLGSQTFSKSITQYPRGAAPLFIKSGKGCRVLDVDNNEYIDFVNSLASITLGYCDESVDLAVSEQLKNGVVFSLPHVLETEVAEKIISMVPCAEMVRFGKNGSDATSAAIRLARAYTGKDLVAVCGYHGWQDWYIGSTARNLGVPTKTQSMTKRFEYNSLSSLEVLLEEYKNEFAAIIMEPMNVVYPEEGFLEGVRALATKHDVVLVFDETITGFRYSRGGAQEAFKVIPDLATFGKGLANGFPLSAVVGNKKIMSLMEDIFFSGTFGGETLSLAASKAVLDKLSSGDVIERIEKSGRYLLEHLNNLINDLELNDYFYTSGHPSWSFLHIRERENINTFDVKTLFLQEMFKRGILSLGSHNISYAHSIADIKELINVYSEVLPFVRRAIDEECITEKLECEPLQPLFKVR